MKKKCILLVATILLGMSLKAQNVEETTIAVGDLTVPAYRIAIDKEAKVVQNAMNQRLKEAKLKTKNTDGYVACIKQVFAEVATTPISLYTKVEEQGRKGERSTVLTVSALSTDLTIDQVAMNNNVRMFVAAFPQYVDRYEAQTQLAAEQQKLKQAQKAQSAAAAAMAAVEKSMSSDQKAISKKTKEIEKLNKKLASLQKEVASLEAGLEKYSDKKASAEQKLNEANEAVSAAQAAVDRFEQLVK